MMCDVIVRLKRKKIQQAGTSIKGTFIYFDGTTICIMEQLHFLFSCSQSQSFVTVWNWMKVVLQYTLSILGNKIFYNNKYGTDAGRVNRPKKFYPGYVCLLLLTSQNVENNTKITLKYKPNNQSEPFHIFPLKKIKRKKDACPLATKWCGNVFFLVAYVRVRSKCRQTECRNHPT